MKPDIHPAYREIKVSCSCGNEFVTRSSLQKDSLRLEICSNCHPHYSGQHKIVDTERRVDGFRKKFSGFKRSG